MRYGGRPHIVLAMVFVLSFSLSPQKVDANFFDGIQNLTANVFCSWFGAFCAEEVGETVIETTVVAEENDEKDETQDTSSPESVVTEKIIEKTTVVEEHNTYNPTEVIEKYFTTYTSSGITQKDLDTILQRAKDFTNLAMNRHYDNAMHGGGGSSASVSDLITGTLIAGDLLYATDADTIVALNIGTEGYVLTMSGGLPTWGLPTGGGGSISTSTTPTISQLTYWTSGSTLGSIATGTLSESITGLELDANQSLIGGSATLSLTAGYFIPTTTRATNWDTAYSWGDHSLLGYLTTVDVSDDTNLSVTATGLGLTGDAVTLTAGYTIPLTASSTEWSTAYSWGNHALLGYLTTVDVSDDTNLAGDTEIVLTGDTLSIASSIARDSELHSALTLTGTPNYLTLIGQEITLNKLDLIDDLNTFSSANLASLLTDETGTGLSVFDTNPLLQGFRSNASSTIAGLTIAGNATTTGGSYFGGNFTGVLLRSDSTNGNYAFGLNALDSLTIGSGIDNVAIGTNAGTAVTTGDNNIFFGTNAGDAVNSGSNNIAIGYNAFGYSSPSASSGSIALGWNAAGQGLAREVVVLGFYGGRNPGDESVIIGSYAGFNFSGTKGVVIGADAAGASFDPDESIAIGFDVDFFSGSGHQLVIGVNNDDYAIQGFMTPNTDHDISSGLTVYGPSAYSAATTNLDGGPLTLVAGSGASGSAGDADGGNLILNGGTGYGTGSNGNVILGATTGNVGIGTTTPSEKLTIWGTTFIGTSTIPLFFADTGADRIGIGTSSPTAQFHTTGTVRFEALGSGGANLTTDANGNVTASSDERLKDIEGTFATSVEALLGIEPIQYRWKESTGFDTENIYTGFSAQNVQEFIPEAVGTDKRGFLTLSERPLLATVINAIKEMWVKIVGHDEEIQKLKAENSLLEQRLQAVEDALDIERPTVLIEVPANTSDSEPTATSTEETTTTDTEPPEETTSLLPEEPKEPSTEEGSEPELEKIIGEPAVPEAAPSPEEEIQILPESPIDTTDEPPSE